MKKIRIFKEMKIENDDFDRMHNMYIRSLNRAEVINRRKQEKDRAKKLIQDI